MCRLENLPGVRELVAMGRAMVDLYCASFRQVPRRIVLDVDDTFDAVHGGQQLRLFNAHHDEYGFQPIVVFDGDGRFFGCRLNHQLSLPGLGFGRRLHTIEGRSTALNTHQLWPGAPRADGAFSQELVIHCDRGWPCFDRAAAGAGESTLASGMG